MPLCLCTVRTKVLQFILQVYQVFHQKGITGGKPIWIVVQQQCTKSCPRATLNPCCVICDVQEKKNDENCKGLLHLLITNIQPDIQTFIAVMSKSVAYPQYPVLVHVG